MVYNRVGPSSSAENNLDEKDNRESSIVFSHSQGEESLPTSSLKDFNDLDSISTLNLEESSYLKLRPFTRLDPTLVRLVKFFRVLGIFLNLQTSAIKGQPVTRNNGKRASLSKVSTEEILKRTIFGTRSVPLLITLSVALLTGEVVYDVNVRQSKLLAEQKRSTPLLTFVIVAYSWLTLVIPIICDFSLVLTAPHLFRFYSRTTATVCNGELYSSSAQDRP